ncbi:response regulator transcription factor [Falsiroseomonas selenitidurans]|uniref:Response regulator transcription factor n=1 Tax=Falsiroseomonas selenitidurans TaxID=2716335 RepID=A0ABX1DYW9_9PROT|nr:response regulator transcription factor [Falsiroseomonas selenitidurans]NKC30107.1 response regulator transcription factor [Falsiroseomonas selenitidurans]
MSAQTVPAAPAVTMSGNGHRPILVVEDDGAVAATICAALGRDGWSCVVAASLAEARARLQRDQPRLVVVDLGLPDGNGIAFVREAASCPDLGVIVVSGRADEVDRIIGLEVGADDYLAKPFSLREMVARVRALSRRLDAGSVTRPEAAPLPAPPAAAAMASEQQGWTVGGLQLQPARMRLRDAAGQETRLTGGEAGLLSLLLAAPDNLADRETISDRVLGRRLLPEQRGVDQLASNLRQKLNAASAGQVTITALRGKGYRLVW